MVWDQAVSDTNKINANKAKQKPHSFPNVTFFPDNQIGRDVPILFLTDFLKDVCVIQL